MRPISRRAVLRGAAAVPVAGPLVAQDLKMRMAGLGLTPPPGPPREVGGGRWLEFTDFAKWFTKFGDEEIRKAAKNVTHLDPDLIEARSPTLQAKVKMQEKRNYARILAEHKRWFDKEISFNRVVKVWG